MHPLSLSDVLNQTNSEKSNQIISDLINFAGFPEPYLKKNLNQLRRWHRQRRERIVCSNIRDLENVKEISNIELLIQALLMRVGSPLSRKNLAHDPEVDFKTVEKWLTILENVYYCYRVLPYGPSKIRAVKKEQKLYFWDWSELDDIGLKWENFVASHLLKYCHFIEDTS
jgi:predicted AAA+ superfamily ATPase